SSRRASQARAWLWSETADNLLARLRDDPSLAERLHELEGAVASGDLAPRVAARELVATLWKEAKDS
ncbi:MAG: methylmalonyl Co-A mutase-associated GTPase MeaB, partial [Gammaproteobacteria bacterium]|nr:methylmalonyl Co-A mutase-associated GTPase MeaB [Gammaproteobacteria bacterium]